MGRAGYIACAVLLLCPLALSRLDDDFAFDTEEFQLDLNVNHSEIEKNGLRRLWGVPDTSAYVGHLFRMEIPKEAFSGEVSSYKVRSESGRHLPSWLAVDTKHGLISGIPEHQDIGVHHFSVTAHGRTHGLTATDSFTIEVKQAEHKPHSKYGTCSSASGANRLVLCIMVDGAFHQIAPRQRIRALMELASFMALDGDEFWMEPYKPSSLKSVLTSGVGTTTRRRGDATTAIYFNVGCGDKLWPRHRVLVGGLREQARDGTLAHTLRLPVLGWRLGAAATLRPKRQTPRAPLDEGSGAYDTYDGEDDADDYSGYGDADDEDDYGTGDTGDTGTGGGDGYDPGEKVQITPYSESASEASNVNYSRIMPIEGIPSAPRKLGGHSPVVIVADDLTTTPDTETDPAISTERTSTIIGQTTETIILPMPVNQPPSLKHHMKKLADTAGKAFKYIIPADLFTDPEEGSNLTFTMYEAENVKLSPASWIQFIPAKREVYGLPLESHVSRWNFIVEAQDSQGLVARGPLDITVQQHKSGRTISHQFVLQFKLNETYTNALDWQIRALEGIVNLFRDTDMEQLTVLNATQSGDLYEFVWTNDTLLKDTECSSDAVKRIMRIMESDIEPGSPSPELVRAMSPQLKVSGVRWRGVGRCAPSAPATRPPGNYPPVTRNQVDHLTATVGHLLVYKVPEDTFYDPEDGNTRHLRLSLRYSDRSPLPAGHWLQFDSNNQEFYGLPGPGDEGAVTYQLIAEDSTQKSAYDSLMVEVVKAPAIRPTVEFQLTMEYPFPMLAYNGNNKRKVVVKLAELFGQASTDNIRIQSITDNPTTIIWYNTSLPMDRCPKREIEELRKMIIVDNRGAVGGALKENVDHVFDKDFKVMAIRLIPQGLCAEQNTKTHKKTIEYAPGNTQPKASSETGYTEYLVTFIIPAVVIVCMIVVAGIIACVLYKRRRTGKMSVGDEEERQAFRSKGIPVIFQDELEERGDAEPAHKSPVIMRDEKPPLLPPAPDYRGSGGEAPYRPPPPFAASRTPPRPKATPTYRKPPPYVPP